ncbi:MAG: L,D-transpeptidase [Anaerolineales bacterium]|jgi:lipoprotein-anchoring transpeptidase ErfK/SrfK
MKHKLSRRDFLKIGALTMGGLAFREGFPPGRYEAEPLKLGRVAYHSISVFDAPQVDARTVGYRFRDTLLNLYERLEPDTGPLYNPVWYRVWGGYVHSAYVQPVAVQMQTPLESVPQHGLLTEVSVPYSQPYNFTSRDGWQINSDFFLYYNSTHWITDVVEGPDQQPWYQITDELDGRFKYYLPAAHLRPFDPDELTPLATDVPRDDKRIEVSLLHQRLIAYEGDREVLRTKISSGISRSVPQGQLPTTTPVGTHYIYSKMPSKHMGQTRLTDDLGDPSLPGVPWTMFFATGGYALHGAYWHSNFGAQMSRGCVNMSIEDSRWLFRWTTPVFNLEDVTDPGGWEVRGQGTRVDVVAS